MPIQSAYTQFSSLPYYYPEMFGCVNDGSVNDQAKLQDFFQTCVDEGKIAVLPGGHYRADSNISITPSSRLHSLRVTGSGPSASFLELKGTATFQFNGGSVNHLESSEFHIDNVGFYRNGNGGSVVYANWDNGAGFANRTGSMRNVDIGVMNTSSSFNSGFNLRNSRQFNAYNCNVKGSHNGTSYTSTNAYYIHGDSSPVSIVLQDCHEHFVNTAHKVADATPLEGLQVIGGETVACSQGTIYRRSADAQEPYVIVKGRHYNVSKIGMDFRNIMRLRLFDNEIWADHTLQSSDLNGNWTGININHVKNPMPKGFSRIIGNTFANAEDVQYTGQMRGVQLSSAYPQSLIYHFDHNFYQRLDVGTRKSSNISGVNMTNGAQYATVTVNHQTF